MQLKLPARTGRQDFDGISEGLLSDRIDGIIRIILSFSHLPDEDEKTQSACLPRGIQGCSTGAAEIIASFFA
jgi:hypothetical protein